jgi:excisionase family DNA binding protein
MGISDDRPYYRPDELTKFLPVCRSVIYREMKSGTIPCMRVGKRIFVPKARFHEWLESLGGKLA